MRTGLKPHIQVNVTYIDLQPGPSELTLSLCASSLSSSLSLRAFASRCKSDGSFRSLLRENAAADVERPILDDANILALSDISLTFFLGREGGTFSGTLKWLSLTRQSEVVSRHSPVSAGWWDRFCKSSVAAAELSEGTRGLGRILGCWLSSDGLRLLVDGSSWGAAAAELWPAFSVPSSAFSGTFNGVSRSAFTGDFAVRARTEGRPGTTLGLTEKRFLRWTAAEEVSAIWWLPSLQARALYLDE